MKYLSFDFSGFQKNFSKKNPTETLSVLVGIIRGFAMRKHSILPQIALWKDFGSFSILTTQWCGIKSVSVFFIRSHGDFCFSLQ